jgi:hypothetical protein
MFTKSSANAAVGGLKPPPAGRLRRANSPSSPAQHRLQKLTYHAPFSVRDTRGFKQSGIGREFGSEGLSEYVELQSTVSAGKLPELR